MLGRILLIAIEDAIRPISGTCGRWIRRWYYRRRFKACGQSLRIESGVQIDNPQFISVGDRVWIDRGVVLTAGPGGFDSRKKKPLNGIVRAKPGELFIGSHCHLGIRTIVQAHGGVYIGDGFTSSANCAIYSLSNDPYQCRMGTVGSPDNPVYYVETPVDIGNNVWLGLQCIVVGNSIGDDCFVQPLSLVRESIPSNTIAGGVPACALRPRFANNSDGTDEAM